MKAFSGADLHGFPSQLDLPSPAGEDLSLRGSYRAIASARARASAGAPNVGTGLAAAPLSPYSDTVVPLVPLELNSPTVTPLPSPSQELPPSLWSSSGSSCLTPFAPVALPTPPPISTPGEKQVLRLPPFDLLGIAAPHPDHRRLPESEALLAVAIGAGPLSKPDDPLHDLSPAPARPRNLDGWCDLSDGRKECDTTRPTIPVVTPPYEATAPFHWPPFSPVHQTAPMDTPTRSDSENPMSSGQPSSRASNTQPLLPASAVVAATPIGWVQGATQSIVSNLPESLTTGEKSVKVLSHALPCPCTPPAVGGHIFHSVIRAIHEDLRPRSTQWINVFHAVPGRFKLDDLPRSPPSTPGPAIGGDDYFTTKIFDSAVQISDYQGDSTVVASPHPVVVPSSVNVSIVERYIPPANTNEFAQMFSPDAKRSIILDRLVELSPDNGMLLLIYPTKQGGRTFTKEYLGPILDPLLRSLTVTHDLPSELGAAVGPMAAVEYLPDYEMAHSKLETMCRVLSENGASLQQFQEKGISLQLIHASKEEVVLDRKIWAEHWWVKQERPRIRDAVTKVFRRSRQLRADSTAIPTDLIHEILSGVSAKRAYPDEQRPKRGIEVGVFVVRKSKVGG